MSKDNRSYSELLRDPRWQRKRLEVMQRADFKCEECGDSESTLNVHHKRYRFNALPWEYDATELRCLCEHCHKETTVGTAAIKQLMGELDSREQQRVVGYMLGTMALRCGTDIVIRGMDVQTEEDILVGICNSLEFGGMHVFSKVLALLEQGRIPAAGFKKVQDELTDLAVRAMYRKG